MVVISTGERNTPYSLIRIRIRSAENAFYSFRVRPSIVIKSVEPTFDILDSLEDRPNVSVATFEVFFVI